MSKSVLKKKIDEFGDDYDADETAPLLPNLGHLSTDGESPMSGVGRANADDDADETAPLLPNLGYLSTDGESPMSSAGRANADVIDERLRQLVSQLGSMHCSLEKIAELLSKQTRRSRPRTARLSFTSERLLWGLSLLHCCVGGENGLTVPSTDSKKL